MARKKIVIMMIFIGKISTFSYILLYMGVYRSTAQIPALSQQERTRSKTFGFLKDLQIPTAYCYFQKLILDPVKHL